MKALYEGAVKELLRLYSGAIKALLRCRYRGLRYCRIDGGVAGDMREEMIDDFMRDDSGRALIEP